MICRVICVAVVVIGALALDLQPAEAGGPFGFANRRAQNAPVEQPWHAGYQNIQYGQPIGLVVPPTVKMRQTYSWGVSQNLMYPVTQQYGRNNPGYGYAPGTGFRHTPNWPSHTDQFGVHYVRAPW
ncbi:hypothetical protein FF011L_54800 [Roseimaritima multifibrata]|uniref:Uncharacterized protein n=1 Tax=Roseimaritima multifibrata TaxID=1930274 RepID=A0A517MP68_9BACT|nr:hypothetical protein [Roseimaritima multifibrata]QDS96668.1 hypothetical protein FF011L_54800 [Roseimaritima multifibrata]